MAQVVRIDDEIYEQLKAEASERGMSMAKLASTRLANTNTPTITLETREVSRENQSGQGKLWNEQQARLNEQEQRIKELTAVTISNRLGVLEVAGENAKAVNEMMQGAYEELLERDIPEMALEFEGFIDG